MKALEGKGIALIRAGQHHTLAITRVIVGICVRWVDADLHHILKLSESVKPKMQLYKLAEQEMKLVSFGRPTYGRLGRKDVDVEADAALPEPLPVDGLDCVSIIGAAGGGPLPGTLWLSSYRVACGCESRSHTIAGLAVSGCFSEAP